MFRSSGIFVAVLSIAAATAGCKSTGRATGMDASLNESANSEYLVEAAGRAKKYIDSLIQERNQFASLNGFNVQFMIVDARDPRLYPAGAPIQPNTPAEKALIKYNATGQFIILAWIQDQPGIYRFKEINGNRIIDIQYAVEKIAYGSRWDGNFASVTRNTSGNGWFYIYYVKRFGNNVNPEQFDNAVATFLQNAVMYMTPL